MLHGSKTSLTCVCTLYGPGVSQCLMLVLQVRLPNSFLVLLRRTGTEGIGEPEVMGEDSSSKAVDSDIHEISIKVPHHKCMNISFSGAALQMCYRQLTDMCSVEGAALLEQAKPDVRETWDAYNASATCTGVGVVFMKGIDLCDSTVLTGRNS